MPAACPPRIWPSGWEAAPDGSSYTFWIRPAARWHDGAPVTAEDVLFTVGLIQNPQYTGPLAAAWRDVQVERLDERTVRFHMVQGAFAPFLEYTSLGLLPAHLLGKLSVREVQTSTFNLQPVGSGPFRVKEVHPSYLILEAAPTFWGPRPYLGRIKFQVYPNYKTILSALERDEVEGVAYLDPEDAARLEGSQKVMVFHAPLSSYTLLFLNVTQPPFNDRAVRQAVACAVDRQKLIDLGRQGQGRRLDGPIPPDSWAYNPDAPRYDYAPDRARQLLDEAGWQPGPDGVRRKGDQPLRFVLLTNDRQERVKVAHEIQRELAAVGMGVEVQVGGTGGLVQDFLLPRRFQAALFSWDFNGFDPDPYAVWHSSQIAPRGLNVSGFNNRRADELLERARKALDQEERARLYREFQALFAEELPSVPLYVPLYSYAVARKVRGVELGLMADPADRFRSVAGWYVKTRKEIVARTR